MIFYKDFIIYIIFYLKNIESSILLRILLFFVEIDSIDAFSISCLKVSKQFAITRLILRFFDDIPAIYNLLKYLDSSVLNSRQIKADENNIKIKKNNAKKPRNVALKVGISKIILIIRNLVYIFM